jgi:uncharacterized phage protein (TIGR02218 family)
VLVLTFQSANAYLLDDLPSWASPVDVAVELPSHTERGLTCRETRRPLAETVRGTVGWTSYVGIGAATELTTLRNALQSLSTERVLCPLWPFPFEAGANPSATAAWYYVPDDPAGPVRAAGDLPFSFTAYPLLIGRLKSVPKVDLVDAETASVEFSFIEDDDLGTGLTFAAYTPPNGLADGSGSARPLFAFVGDWTASPESGGAGIEIERRDLGQLRKSQTAAYAQSARRTLQCHLTLTDDEPLQLLSLFSQLGSHSNFWVPSGINEARLTADVESTDDVLPVDSPGARGANVHLLLDGGSSRTPVKVTGTSGSDWTLSAAIGANYAAATTRIETLVLARFNAARLEIEFVEPRLATARIAFVEVPDEATADGNDDVGELQGAVATTAYLYLFSIAYPDGTAYYRFTDFESALTFSSHSYVPAPIEHDRIRETLALDRQAVTLASRHFAGNPLSLLIPFRLEWPLEVSIYEVAPAAGAATNGRLLFQGQVARAEYDGPFIRATVQSLTALFDRKIPRQLLQPGCNWSLYDAACKVGARAGEGMNNWTWQGTVTAYDSSVLKITLSTVSRIAGSGVTLVNHFFAGGRIKLGTGSAVQHRLISDSAQTPFAIWVGSPFIGPQPEAGNVMYFLPGCDGRFDTCGNKFANSGRYGGFPFMPIGNPSLVKVENKSSDSGGKK